MLVLVLDTSSAAVVAGIADVPDDVAGDSEGAGIAVLAVRSPLAARGHGELLTPSIAECLDDAHVHARDVGAVVAGIGPGPYTGLRVGLATAAAFADAVDAATYGVCSLDALAVQSRDAGGLLVATDARRHEVYWAHYDAAGDRVAGPAVDRPDAVPLAGIDVVAGAGGEVYADVWPQLNRLPYRYPSPESLVSLAADRIRAHAPAEPLTPLYLRRPDAVVPGPRKPVTQ